MLLCCGHDVLSRCCQSNVLPLCYGREALHMRVAATMKVAACKEARDCSNEVGRAQVRAWLHPRWQSRACVREAAVMKVAA